MNNFSKIGVIMLLLLTNIAGYSQYGPGRERIKTLKVAFITERLSLTSAEAQKFWPVYNSHEEQMVDMQRKERQQIHSRMIDFESLSEKEASDILKQLLTLEQEKHRLHIAFVQQMSEIISSKKTFLLIKAEEDFKKRLLKQIQKRRKAGGG